MWSWPGGRGCRRQGWRVGDVLGERGKASARKHPQGSHRSTALGPPRKCTDYLPRLSPKEGRREGLLPAPVPPWLRCAQEGSLPPTSRRPCTQAEETPTGSQRLRGPFYLNSHRGRGSRRGPATVQVSRPVWAKIRGTRRTWDTKHQYQAKRIFLHPRKGKDSKSQDEQSELKRNPRVCKSPMS